MNEIKNVKIKKNLVKNIKKLITDLGTSFFY